MPWSFAGVGVKEVQTGLEVEWVLPDTWAQRVGLQPGDRLLTFGSAPVFTQLCMQTMLRATPAGAQTAATWARGNTLEQGEAPL